jgi:hypothetical protein
MLIFTDIVPGITDQPLLTTLLAAPMLPLIGLIHLLLPFTTIFLAR